MQSRRTKGALVALLGLGLMGTPLFAADAMNGNQARQAVPGTVNYIEGSVYLNGSQLNTKDLGNATVEPGQEISTEKGKAEVLLTPGVFLRLDDNSTVKMISPDLAMTQVQLEKGRAAVEVDEIHDQNDLQVIDANVTTRLNKRGYYEFDANRPEAMVFKGEAHVQVGDDKWEKIKGDHAVALNAGAVPKAQKFDEKDSEDELYNWNSLRSQYMAEANNQMASEYEGPYAGPGWYWDPWSFGYAYMGMGPFASPFGWGFYPYGWGGWGGWGGYPYGGGVGFYRPLGRFHRGDVNVHRGYVGGAVRGNPGHFGGFQNGGHFGSFHNGGGFGGFHGGAAGGFHGGGARR